MPTTAASKPDLTSDQPYREVVVYQGVRYEIESIDTRTFNAIEEQSTRTEYDDDGAKREVLDGKMQMDALMRRMIIAGLPKGGPDKLPIRHFSNLRVRINELCFGQLPNEFKPANEKNGTGKPAEDAEEGEGKGEG